MKKVVLLFPDNISMAEFILSEKPSKVETNSIERSIDAVLTDKQIEIACKRHGASLKRSTQLHYRFSRN